LQFSLRSLSLLPFLSLFSFSLVSLSLSLSLFVVLYFTLRGSGVAFLSFVVSSVLFFVWVKISIYVFLTNGLELNIKNSRVDGCPSVYNSVFSFFTIFFRLVKQRYTATTTLLCFKRKKKNGENAMQRFYLNVQIY
jgi:hypothetical protein